MFLILSVNGFISVTLRSIYTETVQRNWSAVDKNLHGVSASFQILIAEYRSIVVISGVTFQPVVGSIHIAKLQQRTIGSLAFVQPHTHAAGGLRSQRVDIQTGTVEGKGGLRAICTAHCCCIIAVAVCIFVQIIIAIQVSRIIICNTYCLISGCS